MDKTDVLSQLEMQWMEIEEICFGLQQAMRSQRHFFQSIEKELKEQFPHKSALQEKVFQKFKKKVFHIQKNSRIEELLLTEAAKRAKESFFRGHLQDYFTYHTQNEYSKHYKFIYKKAVEIRKKWKKRIYQLQKNYLLTLDKLKKLRLIKAMQKKLEKSTYYTFSPLTLFKFSHFLYQEKKRLYHISFQVVQTEEKEILDQLEKKLIHVKKWQAKFSRFAKRYGKKSYLNFFQRENSMPFKKGSMQSYFSFVCPIFIPSLKVKEKIQEIILSLSFIQESAQSIVSIRQLVKDFRLSHSHLTLKKRFYLAKQLKQKVEKRFIQTKIDDMLQELDELKPIEKIGLRKSFLNLLFSI